jgi:hypothetical protein
LLEAKIIFSILVLGMLEWMSRYRFAKVAAFGYFNSTIDKKLVIISNQYFPLLQIRSFKSYKEPDE